MEIYKHLRFIYKGDFLRDFNYWYVMKVSDALFQGFKALYPNYSLADFVSLRKLYKGNFTLKEPRKLDLERLQS